jgi:hypothetical protein
MAHRAVVEATSGACFEKKTIMAKIGDRPPFSAPRKTWKWCQARLFDRRREMEFPGTKKQTTVPDTFPGQAIS